jgi:hypothetical protein
MGSYCRVRGGARYRNSTGQEKSFHPSGIKILAHYCGDMILLRVLRLLKSRVSDVRLGRSMPRKGINEVGRRWNRSLILRVLLRVLNIRRRKRGMHRSLSEVVRRVGKDRLGNVSFAVPVDACFAGTNLTLLSPTV